MGKNTFFIYGRKTHEGNYLMGTLEKPVMNTAIAAAPVVTKTTPTTATTTAATSPASTGGKPPVAPNKSQIQVFGQNKPVTPPVAAAHVALAKQAQVGHPKTVQSAKPAQPPHVATTHTGVAGIAGGLITVAAKAAASGVHAAQQTQEKPGSVWGTLTRFYSKHKNHDGSIGFVNASPAEQIELSKRYIAQFASDVQKGKIDMFYRDAKNALQSTVFTTSIIQNSAVSTQNLCHAAHVGLTTGRVESKNAAADVLANNLGKINKDAVGCVATELAQHGPAKAVIAASTHVSEVHDSKQVEVVQAFQKVADKTVRSKADINIINQYGKFAKSAEIGVHRVLTEESHLDNIVQYSATKIHKMDKTHQAEAVGITLHTAKETKNVQAVRLVAREFDAFDVSARANIKSQITTMVSNEAFLKNDSVTQNLLHQAEYRIQTGQKPLADLNEKYFSEPNKIIETRVIESQAPDYSGVVEEDNTTAEAAAQEATEAASQTSAQETSSPASLSPDEQSAFKKVTGGKDIPSAKDFNTILDLLSGNKLGELEKRDLADRIMNSTYMKSKLSQIPTLDPALQMILVEAYISSGNVMDLKDKVDMFTNLSAKAQLQNKINEEQNKVSQWLTRKGF